MSMENKHTENNPAENSTTENNPAERKQADEPIVTDAAAENKAAEAEAPKRQSGGKRAVIAALCILCALVFAFGGLWLALKPQTQVGSKAVTISVDDGQSDPKEFVYRTDEETLGALLVNTGLAQGESSTYGLFIQTVNGVTADTALQQWWCVTRSGEMLTTGADATPIADGEHYELVLTTGW